MKKISRDNYEEFFLDYMEGTLNPFQLILVEEFLEANPDLRLELDEMQMPVMKAKKVDFSTDFLKDIPFQNNFDDFSIARLEGDLTKENEIAFDAFVKKNIVYEKENAIYKKTKLTPNKEILFENKDLLKKDKRKITFLWYLSRIGVAASIVLLFSLWNISSTPEREIIQFAKTETNRSKIKIIKSSGKILENNIEKATIEIETKKEVVITKLSRGSESNKKESTRLAEKEQKLSTAMIDVPVIKAEAKIVAITNTVELNGKLKVPVVASTKNSIQSSGLTELGMSWKSSVTNTKGQKTVLYAIAKYGIDKISKIAGKNVQLEKQYDAETEKTRLSFNTTGLGFSKTIKKDL